MIDRAILGLLACPACLGTLTVEGTGDMLLRCLACARAFTVRAGAPDLIWGKNPPNEGPGDTAEMVRRRRTLDRTLAKRSRALARYVQAIGEHVAADTALLDVGTGPGTIPRLVAERATVPVTIVAFDKSWPALDCARATLAGLPRVGLLRASGRRRFPLRSGAFGLVTRRLAPALPEEILRVLAPGGTLVAFTYGARHWSAIYDVLPELPRPRQTAPRPAETEAALREQGFSEAAVAEYEEREEVSVDEITLTLGAGPAAYFFSRERDESRLLEVSRAQGHPGTLEVTAHYAIRVATAPH